ncbi:MAG: type II secretion system F family protein, partial [Thermoguttaceae bacterium]
MPDYIYSARTAAGKDVSGTMTADSSRDVLESLHRQSLFPIRVDDARRGEISLPSWNRRVSDSLVSATLTQLADLLENGVTILSAFQIIVKQTTHSTLKKALLDIHDRVADGEGIPSAFAAYPNIFNTLTISVIRAGAEGA